MASIYTQPYYTNPKNIGVSGVNAFAKIKK